jgi:peptidoglycan/xylan/chitin deacetylase (PgdA/CDA1 family)
MTTGGGHNTHAAASGRRPRLARMARSCGLLPLAGRLRALLRDDLRILAYHRVLESADPPGFAFDVDLISASADAFRTQMQLLKARFNPMRFDELCDRLEHGRSLPPRTVLVTFDDGYEDNHRIAFPILRDLDLSAMFFVSTGHIESGAPYAYDWLVHMLCTTQATQVDLPELGMSLALPPSVEARRGMARQLLDRIKVLDATGQERLVERLERAWGMPRAAGHAACAPMRWDGLRQMQAAGMEVGSHGVHHRMLAKLPVEDMRQEVFESKAAIEREIAARVDVLSYPVGGPDAYDAEVIQAVRDAGYRMACSYQAGAEHAPDARRYRLRRIPVERQMDDAWFEATMALPEVFAYPSRARNG